MKKLIALTLLGLSISLPSLAQTQTLQNREEGVVTYTYQVNQLTLTDLKNHPEITALLSLAERKDLSQQLSLDPTQALWQNLIPFGYGSFQQGDTVGGISIAVMDALSLFAFSADLSVVGNPGAMPLGLLLYGPLLIIARVTGVISPLLYAQGHNTQVHQLLHTAPLSQNSSGTTSNLFSYSLGF